MGYLKFTNFKTGKVYDSREPLGFFKDDEKNSRGEVTLATEREPVYKYPKGKDIWIDDPELADALECEVEEIECTLNRLLDGK